MAMTVMLRQHTTLNATLLGGERRSWRQLCWLIVGGQHPRGYLPGTLFQALIMLLVSLNVLLVIVATEPDFARQGVAGPFNTFYQRFEMASVTIFGLEYAARIWSCPESRTASLVATAGDCTRRMRWVLTPLALIDLAALLPFIIDLAVPRNTSNLRGVSLIRLLRVFSLLRMERSFNSFARVAHVLRNKRDELMVTLFIAFIILVLSASLMYYLENGGDGASSSSFSSISTAMWWSVTALTTVGYGDIYPTTVSGRVLGALTAFLGVGLFALPAGIFASGFAELLDDGTPPPGGGAADAAEPAVAAPAAAARGNRRSAVVTSPDAVARPSLAAPSAAPGTAVPLLSSQLELVLLRQTLAALEAGQPRLAAALLRERLDALGAAGALGGGEDCPELTSTRGDETPGSRRQSRSDGGAFVRWAHEPPARGSDEVAPPE